MDEETVLQYIAGAAVIDASQAEKNFRVGKDGQLRERRSRWIGR